MAALLSKCQMFQIGLHMESGVSLIKGSAATKGGEEGGDTRAGSGYRGTQWRNRQTIKEENLIRHTHAQKYAASS